LPGFYRSRIILEHIFIETLKRQTTRNFLSEKRYFLRQPGRIITESVELVSLPRPKSFWHFYQNEYRPTGSFLRKAIYDIGQQFWPYCFLWQLKRLIEISSAGSLKF